QDYVLYLYSQPNTGDGSTNGRQTTFTVTDLNGTQNTTTTLSDQDALTFVLNQNYVAFNVTSTASGTLGIDVTVGAGEAALSGFQLQTVPEPSTYALMLASVAALAGYRRFKKK
ncbi:MAG: PEP-CTERM sorting domain-containing protein, partial [Verrucomicrobiota bacterium]